jgi:hypothetical protein
VTAVEPIWTPVTRRRYAQKAIDALKASGDADVNGTDFKPITVKLNPGGA